MEFNFQTSQGNKNLNQFIQFSEPTIVNRFVPHTLHRSITRSNRHQRKIEIWEGEGEKERLLEIQRAVRPFFSTLLQTQQNRKKR